MPIPTKQTLTEAIMQGSSWTDLIRILDISEGEIAKGLKTHWATGSLVEVRKLLGAPEPMYNTGFKCQGFRYKKATV
jgi:hypothetical protein